MGLAKNSGSPMSSSSKLALLCLSLSAIAFGQPTTGRVSFQNRCAGCHGSDGNGGEHGPSILARLQRTTSDPELTTFLNAGVPLRGMPAFSNVPAAEMSELVAFMRTLTQRRGRRGPVQTRIKVQLTTGAT